MKRSFNPLLCLALTHLAHGQGTVLFLNHTSAVSAPVFDVGGTTPLGDPTAVAALFYGDVQEGASAHFRTGFGAGYWDPGSDATRVIDGQPGGAIVTLQVRVWNSTKGSTFAAAVAAGSRYAISDPFTITLGSFGSPPSAPADMVGLKAFHFLPEPSTTTLVLAGITGLGWIQLRKSRQPNLQGSGHDY